MLAIQPARTCTAQELRSVVPCGRVGEVLHAKLSRKLAWTEADFCSVLICLAQTIARISAAIRITTSDQLNQCTAWGARARHVRALLCRAYQPVHLH